MDSRTHLDYVLFQLTPTRTRCDLVIFAGKKKEKLASGLLEPFLLHLKQAKDQISKGGYSLTLQPTSNNASWFTKATLERFVRFVSTPEVLERFVTIETEIMQIENSIQQNEQTNGVSESKGSADAIPEENSKVHLLRALETRKVVLRKEQAMAYARALVAGFEMDYIDDLISFSDSFGAIRLREACINFRELCNKKSDDGIWMDEVAAMQAFAPPDLSYLGTSGILIAGEDNNNTIGHASLDTNLDNNGMQKTAMDQSTESKVQIPPWAQYMHNFQQMPPPPYQGYYLPGMQFPNYPPNVPWPVNVEDSNHKRGSSRNKQNKGTKSKTKESDSDDPSKSSSSSDYSHDVEENGGKVSTDKNRHGKRSSRKVVIRNINYITSKRNEDTSEDDDLDGDDVLDGGSLKQKVDEALGTLDKHHKSASYKNKKRDFNKHYRHESDDVSELDTTDKIASMNEGVKKGSQEWDIFQNLLMKDTDSRGADTGASTEHYQELVNGSILESEKSTKYHGNAADSFMFDEMIQPNNGRPDPLNFETGKSAGTLLKRGGSGTEEELILLQRGEDSRINGQDPSTDSALESGNNIKNTRHEDWVDNNQLGNFPKQGTGSFSYDDSSMFTVERMHTEGHKKRDVFVDDSFMVQAGAVSFSVNPEPKTDIFLESDIAGTQSKTDGQQDRFVGSSGSYEPDDLYMVLGRGSVTEQTVTSWNPELDYVNDNSAVEKQSDAVDNKKPLSNSKSTKTDVNRSLETKGPNKFGRDPLGRTKSDILSRNKTTPARKTMSPMSKAKQEEENQKRMEQLRIQRLKRIAERSTGNGSNGVSSRSNLMGNKKDAVISKMGKTLPKTSNEDTKKVDKPVFRSSTADRLSVARKVDTQPSASPKVSLKKASVSTPQKSAPQHKKLNQIKTDSLISEAKQTEDTKEKEIPAIKELHIVPMTAKNEGKVIPNGNTIPSAINASVLPDQNGHMEDDDVKGKPDATHVQDITETVTDVSPSLPSNMKENGTESKKLYVAAVPEVVSMDDEKATPPPDDDANLDTNYSRKKWNDGENSPKVSKGFRKLLLFGRKN